jgi:hypothetical protein
MPRIQKVSNRYAYGDLVAALRSCLLSLEKITTSVTIEDLPSFDALPLVDRARVDGSTKPIDIAVEN